MAAYAAVTKAGTEVAWLAGEGEHEPGEGEGDDEEVKKIAEGEEDALLARGAGEPGKRDGDGRGAEEHGGEVSEMHFQYPPLNLPTMGDLPDVEDAEIVQEAGGGQETSAVIAEDTGRVRAVRLEKLGQKIKCAGANFGKIAENSENILAAGRVGLAAQQVAGDSQRSHANEQNHSPTPSFEQEMAESGDEPGGKRIEIGLRQDGEGIVDGIAIVYGRFQDFARTTETVPRRIKRLRFGGASRHGFRDYV